MKANEGFVLKNILEEYMLLPTGSNIDRFAGTVVLNQVSAFLWEKLRQDTTRQELLEALLREYDVPRETAEKDLDRLLARFREYGLITE